MNDNAKAWVAALRSGGWQQAHQALRKTNKAGDHSFCCLGVACELSGFGSWGGEAFQDTSQVEAKCKHDAGEATCDDCWEDDDGGKGCEGNGKQFISEEYASPMVQEWLGLLSNDGELTLAGGPTSLAVLNDSGKSFAEIADIIERHQDQLFKA